MKIVEYEFHHCEYIIYLIMSEDERSIPSMLNN